MLLSGCSSAAIADSCLQTDKRGSAGDSHYYDYGRCSPGGSNQSYDSLGVIARQLQGMMSSSEDPADRGYSDADRSANLKALAQFAADQDARRSAVKLGATIELIQSGDLVYSRYQYAGAGIAAGQQQAIRDEIGNAINNGKLLETYAAQGYEDRANAATWGSKDPVTRWKTCEVATQLSRAYAYGDFIEPQQKNPVKALAIARAGYQEHCGGTAYWLGRIYEDGDALVAGVDRKDLREDPKQTFLDVYDIAILNGYSPAYERMAELYRLGGPPRYRGKKWSELPRDDAMFLSKFQYTKCLQAEPTNLPCAKGLSAVYSDKRKAFDYTNYDSRLAAYYSDYATKLEDLLSKAETAAAGGKR